MIRYSSLDVHINSKPYELDEIPATYTPLHSYFLDENNVGPIYTPIPGETGWGKYTIADMIDMYYNEVPFRFVYHKDIYEVDAYVNEYVKIMLEKKKLSQLTLEAEEYINRAEKFSLIIRRKAIATRKQYKEEEANVDTFSDLIKGLAYHAS